jgi:CRISPR-associated endonuclease Cas3-HD
MERSNSKAERLLQLEQILLAFQEGLRKAEIARKLGVHRSTVGRYVEDLSRRLPIWEDGNLVGINRDDYLTSVRLTIHESMAVHLAARLMATRTDKHNPHAASALRKLGNALEKFAPQVSRHLLASADVMDDAARRHDPGYLRVLETLTRAWSDGWMVHLWHRHADGQVYEYDFAPYFIEPYAVGQTTHVIGWREPPGAIRTFKIERIQRIEMIRPARPYTIPESFDPRELLAEAWGIWYTEAQPVEVVLRFHPRVARRVRETRWHRSEHIEEQPDGSLIWHAQVAEPQEMLPWIRGWGADVEALAPEDLRDRLIKETRKTALLYQLESVSPPPPYQLLWAKTDRKTGQTHPLICHLIDVAQVTLALWHQVFTESIRSHFAQSLELDDEAAGRLLAFWAGLHDLSKASPAFQRKYPPAELDLKQAGFTFPKVFARESFPHGTASARLLPPFLTETGLPEQLVKGIARAVGGHHGAWPIPGELNRLKATQLGDEVWEIARRELVQALTGTLTPPAVERMPESQTERNALFTLLSGLTAVADWIGSMEEHFPYTDAPIDLVQYTDRAARQAQRALNALNWAGWSPAVEPVDFATLFQVPGPRPMQAQVIDLAERLDHPTLVIIEAPTGIGKTEAALYLADHWARALRQRGLYVAMPTMATSNQMFDRVCEMLERRYPERAIEPLLVHSQARWVRESRCRRARCRRGGRPCSSRRSRARDRRRCSRRRERSGCPPAARRGPRPRRASRCGCRRTACRRRCPR